MKRKNIAILLVLPTIVILAAIVIFPLVYSLNVSFRNYDIRLHLKSYPFIGAGNYIRMFEDPRFFNSLINTVIMVIGELGLQFPIGLGLALLFTRDFRGKRAILPLIIIPSMITPVVVGYMGRLLFETRSGPINYMLNTIGIESLRWHTSSQTALLTVILIDTWEWTPFVMMILLAGLLSLPQEPFESAKVDGASGWQIFGHLTLPLLKPVIAIVIIMRSLDTLRVFDVIYVLTMGGPGISTENVNLYAYLAGFRYWNIGYASSIAWFLAIVLSIGITLFFKLMKEGA